MHEECAIFRQPNSLYWRLLLPLGGALLLAMLAAWAIALKLLTTVIDQQLDAKLSNATALVICIGPMKIGILTQYLLVCVNISSGGNCT